MRPMIYILSLLFAGSTYAQNLPPFKSLRYDEDYRFLAKDSALSLYGRFKYQPLSSNKKNYLSMGGELRYQFLNTIHEEWSAAPADSYLFSRFLTHADLHLGDHLRFFTQLQGSMANGKASPASAVDENILDLHQAFVDISSLRKKGVFRLGRQEFSYGSQRLISVRELPNNRQAFDAAKAMITFDRHKLDVFYGHYVSAHKGVFDDVSSRDIQLWGVYWVNNRVPVIRNVDLYYIGLHKNKAVFNDGAGKEQRHSIGTRVWGGANGWKYDFEMVYQFGKFAAKTISAWTASSNTTYQFSKAKWRPVLGLKTEIISGDRQTGDNRLGTFNPLFPRGAYFGLAAFIGPANLFDIHSSFSLEPVKGKLVWTIDHDVFWRNSVQDGIYAPNVSMIFPAGNSGHRLIGHQLATDITYTPNRALLLRAETTWFAAGDYLKTVSAGKNILFFGVTTQYKF